jgi:hypothetical protein
MSRIPQTAITLLVDATGSMSPYASQVVDGLNYYTQTLCAQAPGPVFATLATFAEDVTVQYTQRPIHRVDKVRLETYHPSGNTALYDAIASILERVPPAPEQRQLVIILSDGEDVCSHTPLTDCAARVAQAQARGVQVVFLGDGPEALAVAALLGIPEGNRYLFTARAGMRQVFASLATSTVQALASVVKRGELPAQFFDHQQN